MKILLTKKALTRGLLVFAFALLLLANPASLLAATPAANLSTNKNSVSAGDTFTISVGITAPDNGATGADIEVTFPADKVEITGNITSGGFFPNFVSTSDSPGGVAYLHGLVQNTTPITPITGSGTLGVITLKVKSGASGQIPVNISCPSSQTNLLDASFQSVLNCNNVSGTTVNITTGGAATTPSPTQTQDPGTTPSPTQEEDDNGTGGDGGDGDDDSGGETQAALACGNVCDSNNIRCPSDAPYCIEYDNDNLPYRCGKSQDPKAGPSCSSTPVTLRPTRPPAGGTSRITPSRITPTPQPVKLSKFTPLALNTPEIPTPTPTSAPGIGEGLTGIAGRIARIVLLIAIAIVILYIIRKLLKKRRSQSGPPPSTPSGPSSTGTVSLPPVFGGQQSPPPPSGP